MPYPKISIRFCIKCKWNLRSAWYLQELLQTFGEQIGEISLIPGETGEFGVEALKTEDGPLLKLWDRKVDGGFPDSKYLKKKVKEGLFDDPDGSPFRVGEHIERDAANKTLVTDQCDSGKSCLVCQEN
ncbi:LAMI_0G17590g1_1 [Lachancea mirantina]|uniref:LAMI_0G17590g1_1 n=1 Tax=Lachancea mirantina TaxID=1230905 RepID=A0A1G4KCW2_9SACH|nr:LAMI_0G17590g1_1 [Lachancea mirantina]